MNPKASIVIPAYNAQKFLSQAIISAREQSVKDIEIIIVDDGSTDGTLELARWHEGQDGRVRVIHTENNGRSDARNTGNREATAPVILVLDSDDIATKNRVADTLSTMKKEKADLAYGPFYQMDVLGNILDKRGALPFDPNRAKETKFNGICHSTMAYTKELANRIAYSSGVWSELGIDDWKFQWDAFKSGAIFKTAKTFLCYYRQYDTNTMATRDHKKVDATKEAYFAEQR